MLRTSVLAAAALLWTSAALAYDEAEGRECATSDDCGPLHCVEGVCTAIVNGKAARAAPAQISVGDAAMFGRGNGYTATIVVADVVATLAASTFVALSAATGSGVLAVAGAFPTTLTGPLVHLAEDRPVPALISFFAWASVPPTALLFGFLAGFSGGFGNGNQSVIAVAVGTGISVAGAVGLTALDAYFARDVNVRATRPRRSFSWAPAIAPTRTGFTASIVGTF